MKKIGVIMFFIGFISLMTGIYISTHWTITGTVMGVAGGMVMGWSTYFFIKIKTSNYS